MKRLLFFIVLFVLIDIEVYSQSKENTTSINGYMVPVCVYHGDTIPSLRMPVLYVFKPLNLNSKKKRQQYTRLVRNVKRTLPIAKEVNRAIIETYEYLQTLPNDKAREKHLSQVEKSIKEQYTPVMKKLTF